MANGLKPELAHRIIAESMGRYGDEETGQMVPPHMVRYAIEPERARREREAAERARRRAAGEDDEDADLD